MKRILQILITIILGVAALAAVPQDDNTRKRAQDNRPIQRAANRQRQTADQKQQGGDEKDQGKANDKKKTAVKEQPKLVIEDETIPDSLLHPRWKIQKTSPTTTEDLDTSSVDLRMPVNIKQQAVYDDSLGLYFLGSKIGDSYLNTPIYMTPQEYLKWTERRARDQFFRKKNDENVVAKGKEKFNFSDIHFDLGPAEKIFGPGGVRIKTQGTAELKLGMTMKDVDNPSLPIRNRKTSSFDFDEKINLSVNGKVGDKVNMNLNYNTDATFDFDTKNLKLKYDGKEDEIIKLVEAGNVTFPSNNSLVKGATSLFGIRADMQFGKLTLQTVLSQKNSTTKSVSTKGGTQTSPFELNVSDYEENRHFFLSHFFRRMYDRAMQNLPNVTSGIKINRVEVWVTNKSGNTTNSRNIVGFTDLGEPIDISNPQWGGLGSGPADNQANNEYATLTSLIDINSRGIDEISAQLEGIPKFVGGIDYEKLASARLLTSSEYSLNSALGYISLKTTLQPDQVLAVAFEYTYGGTTYQVGEFSSNLTQTDKTLFVKTLKNTQNSPQQGNWRLMMKNVYYLAQSIEKEKFRMDIKYQSDTTGTYLNYLPESQLKNTTLLKQMGLDRLDANMKPHPNGQFDFVQGYTVEGGRIFLPSAEPFGSYLRNYLKSKGLESLAQKYCFDALYDSTKTQAKQNAEKNKYIMTGQYKGSSGSVIQLGAYNVPQGSVVVTAGGMRLQEGSDYTVDYASGEVTILNQSIIDSGTNVNVSLEDNTQYGMQRKTMFGVNWDYAFSKNFSIGGTLQHLQEQPLTTKVSMGEEPLNNTIWGLNINWKQESQWLTKMLNYIPFLHVSQPSQISFTGEFAQLFTGTVSGIQDNASYIDDFENAKNLIDISEPKAWVLSSVPSMFNSPVDKTTVASGYGRALLAWYSVDPIFTLRSSSLTPAHIKSDLEQLSNHYVREVYVSEVFPNRQQSTYNGAVSTLQCLNLAYYPKERGPYNLTLDFNADGTLAHPSDMWGGMMRRLETTDFEEANIEYVEFWMLDPFIYTRKDGTAGRHSGELYLNLGEISEDVLCDGKKFYESGMPVDGSSSFTSTQWGKIPQQATQTYAFATTSGSRELQDVGLNGLNDTEERQYGAYREWLNAISGIVQKDSLLQAWMLDPAGDDYHYYRGSDFDAQLTSIMDRYKRINNPQGNSPAGDNQTESYDTSYKTGPDVEDINQDFTLNEYERYYQYRVPISDDDLQAYNRGQKSADSYIVDHRDYIAKLRNGDTATVRWYQYRVPLAEYKEKVGTINDFTSIRFMRMFLTGFEEPIVLRFGSLDLVRGTWRKYKQSLNTGAGAETGVLEISAVNIEENTDRKPVAYVMPPGISRATDPSQPQLVENNEQALCLTVKNLSQNESKAVYKHTNLDLRRYKHLQMYVHANYLVPNTTQLEDDQLAVFIRLGSDYKNNYYEYLIPLKVTPEGTYRWMVSSDRLLVWPTENMLDIDMSIFTQLKKARNKARSTGTGSFTQVYSDYDQSKPSNLVSILGNPSLGEIKTMVIGVRNMSSQQKSGEIWVNELRLLDTNNNGGWAASGTLNIQFSDFGMVNLTGRYITEGFGGLEDNVMQRNADTEMSYAITTNMELGKFFPDKAKVSIPVYYSFSKDIVKPKYNPLDSDMELDDALESAIDGNERDSIESIAVSKHVTTNFSISNARVGIKSKKHPMPYDPTNFSFSYSHAHERTTGKTTVWDTEDRWRGSLNYSYSPVYKTWEPFKKMKGKSKWLDMPKAFGINYLPQSISFNTEISRTYNELLERDLENTENPCLPITFNEQFLWNREFQMRWDFTKNLHMNFQSATHAQIEEPYSDKPLNKSLYPDRYSEWKDSIWTSILHWGMPLDYQQSFQASYQLPLNKIPIFDWINADASYNATYSWLRGTELEDGTSLGNTISNNRNLNINGAFNLETLYNHFPFLKKTNERFKKQQANNKNTKKPAAKKPTNAKKDGKDMEDKKAEKELPKNKNTYQRELKLFPDSAITVQHGKKSKRLYVTARTKQGKTIQLKWKALDQDKIQVWLPRSAFEQQANTKKAQKNKKDSLQTQTADSLLAQADTLLTQKDSMQAKTDAKKSRSEKLTVRKDKKKADYVKSDVADLTPIDVKISVMPKKPIEEMWWYSPTQYVARGLMMIRNINLSYRNQRSMMVPSFIPNAGDAFGQRTGSVLAPGLDFAFGLVGDSYLQKAIDNEWLLMTDSTATPSTSSTSEDLQLKATLEPVRDLKIDLNASRTMTKAKSVQFMYKGMPTTQSGSFNMTTISIQSALEGMGDANNGYHSSSFNKFRERIAEYQQLVQSQYTGATPSGVSSPKVNTVDPYSADVLVPAFLSTYTLGGSSSLDIFPALLRMLPNWTIRYAGLSKLPWIRDHFKSVNLNHGYKSVYAVGSYNSYSSWIEYMGDLGFVKDADGSYTPSSLYNVPTVSINEAFSPLIGLDVTLNNNLTAKVEYRTTRVLNLSMTSVQINEALSKDFVIGLGYKFQNLDVFSLFSGTKSRKIKGNKNSRNGKQQDDKKQQDNKKQSSTSKSGVNHDLNTRFDISFRKQASITRDIATGVSSASSGNSALKITFSADYTLSRYLTLTAYYDRQTNTPLLSSSSYPTTTQDFGVSLKFSLTR